MTRSVLIDPTTMMFEWGCCVATAISLNSLIAFETVYTKVSATSRRNEYSKAGDFGVAIDKSLRRRGRLVRSRNVLTREERIDQMKREETWIGGQSPLGLRKERGVKITAKKKKKAKKKGGEEGNATPEPGGAASYPHPAAKPGDRQPAAQAAGQARRERS